MKVAYLSLKKAMLKAVKAAARIAIGLVRHANPETKCTNKLLIKEMKTHPKLKNSLVAVLLCLPRTNTIKMK